MILLAWLRQFLVLWFGRVPQVEWDGKRWKGHDGKCNPIEQMRRETFVEIGQANDTAFTWLRADSVLDGIRIFGGFVLNFGRRKVEVTVGFWSNDNNVWNVGLWCNAINFNAQFATNNIEGFWMETIVNCVCVYVRERECVYVCVCCERKTKPITAIRDKVMTTPKF